MKELKIEPNFDGQGIVVINYKIVDENGTTQITGSYRDCYYYLLSNWNKTERIDYSSMFRNCKSLEVTKAKTIDDFRKELQDLINKYSKENGSDTPDFILAEYLTDCLKIFDKTIQLRNHWYGIMPNESRMPVVEISNEKKEHYKRKRNPNTL